MLQLVIIPACMQPPLPPHFPYSTINCCSYYHILTYLTVNGISMVTGPHGEGAAWQSNNLGGKKGHISMRRGATVGYRTQLPYIVTAAGHSGPAACVIMKGLLKSQHHPSDSNMPQFFGERAVSLWGIFIQCD